MRFVCFPLVCKIEVPKHYLYTLPPLNGPIHRTLGPCFFCPSTKGPSRWGGGEGIFFLVKWPVPLFAHFGPGERDRGGVCILCQIIINTSYKGWGPVGRASFPHFGSFFSSFPGHLTNSTVWKDRAQGQLLPTSKTRTEKKIIIQTSPPIKNFALVWQIRKSVFSFGNWILIPSTFPPPEPNPNTALLITPHNPTRFVGNGCGQLSPMNILNIIYLL